MEPHQFKVIIVGGSVAGLSLAKMLERAGIDFVVLEAFSIIAPQVGASIGLLGNGMRILDQLGMYDSLSEAAPDFLRSATSRAKSGIIVRHSGLDRLFLDRQVLFSNKD
jgi:2-polyprenyl-6-methoxyphenol hydroxylase-like FAD-dependent oxidoreductase